MGQKWCCVTSQASQIIKSDILSSLLGALKCHGNICSPMKALCWKEHALEWEGWGGEGERMNENDNEILDWGGLAAGVQLCCPSPGARPENEQAGRWCQPRLWLPQLMTSATVISCPHGSLLKWPICEQDRCCYFKPLSYTFVISRTMLQNTMIWISKNNRDPWENWRNLWIFLQKQHSLWSFCES